MDPFTISDNLTNRNLKTLDFLGNVVSTAFEQRTNALKYQADVESKIAGSAQEMYQTEMNAYFKQKENERMMQAQANDNARLKVAQDAELRLKRQHDDNLLVKQNAEKAKEKKIDWQIRSTQAANEIKRLSEEASVIKDRASLLKAQLGGTSKDAQGVATVISGAWGSAGVGIQNVTELDNQFVAIQERMRKLSDKQLGYESAMRLYDGSDSTLAAASQFLPKEDAPQSIPIPFTQIAKPFGPSDLIVNKPTSTPPTFNEIGGSSDVGSDYENIVANEYAQAELNDKITQSHLGALSGAFNLEKPEQIKAVIDGSRRIAVANNATSESIAMKENEFYESQKKATFSQINGHIFNIAKNSLKERPSSVTETQKQIDNSLAKLSQFSSAINPFGSSDNSIYTEKEVLEGEMNDFLNDKEANPKGLNATVSDFNEYKAKQEANKPKTPTPSALAKPVPRSGSSIIPTSSDRISGGASSNLTAERRKEIISSLGLSPNSKEFTKLDKASDDEDFLAIARVYEEKKKEKSSELSLPASIRDAKSRTDIRGSFIKDPDAFIKDVRSALRYKETSIVDSQLSYIGLTDSTEDISNKDAKLIASLIKNKSNKRIPDEEMEYLYERLASLKQAISQLAPKP
jgi:hypothetical protein